MYPMVGEPTLAEAAEEDLGFIRVQSTQDEAGCAFTDDDAAGITAMQSRPKPITVWHQQDQENAHERNRSCGPGDFAAPEHEHDQKYRAASDECFQSSRRPQ